MKHFTLTSESSPREGKASGVAQYILVMTKGQKKSEIIIYVVLWAVLFAAPVVSMLVGDIFAVPSEGQGGETAAACDWDGVMNAWGLLAMFCVTFFAHNFLVAPLLVYRNSKWGYGGGVFVLVACFVLFQLYGRPHGPTPMEGRGKPGMEKMADSPGRPEEKPDEPGRPEGMDRPQEPGRPDGGRRPKEPGRKPPLVFGGQDSVAIIIMTLLIGLNIGVKYFFKSIDDRKRMKELERESLTSQLAYLKYQINPHFFMNTLNNIHALVDIDPEQAKYTIEVLSKMMRYVLYEGDKSMAPLQKELDFIANYIELMRIRYTDKVRISVSLPSAEQQGKALPASQLLPNIEVPSMLLINFVENAFKHGVSYRKESFIEVSMRIDEGSRALEFLCANSRKPASEDKHGGVGLKNTVKRLQLIYGKDGYDLHVFSNEEEYRILLRLPVNPLDS